MTAKRLVAAVAAVATSVALAACTTSIPPEVLSSSSAAMSSRMRPAVPEPTLEQLQKLLNKVLNPKIPAEKKLDTIEGAGDSPELFEKIAQASRESKADIKLSGQIVPTDRKTRTVHVELAIPGQPPQGGEIQFVFDDGKWKVSKAFVCSTITMLMPDSVPAACLM